MFLWPSVKDIAPIVARCHSDFCSCISCDFKGTPPMRPVGNEALLIGNPLIRLAISWGVGIEGVVGLNFNVWS